MANETQTNSASSGIPTQVSPKLIMNFREPLIMTQFAYQEDLTSTPGLTVNVPTWSTTLTTTAIASGANEADAGSNSQVTTSSVALTAASKGVWVQASRLLESSTTYSVPDAVQYEIGRTLATKVEIDLATLLGGHANSVGASGVNATVENLRQAVLTYRTNALEHAMNAVIVIHPQQLGDIEAELTSGSGAGLAAVFVNNGVAALFGEQPGASVLGSYAGHFMQIPVFISTNVATANAGADRAGAIFARSVGNSQYAAYGIVWKWMPVIEAFNSGVNRQLATQYQGSIAFGVTELNDTLGVSIITDA